jgi:RNA polymerase sigma-70 factor (ECF subfamily)
VKGTADFTELVREHQKMVFSLAYHFLRDQAQAEELAQEVFLQLYRSLGSIESGAHAAFWLRKVTSHRAIDAARRRKRRPQLRLADVPEPAVAAEFGDPLLGGALGRLLASLPETARMILILRYQEDLDPAEIAAVLDLPVGTVKSKLQRALALLREKLARSRGEVRL